MASAYLAYTAGQGTLDVNLIGQDPSQVCQLSEAGAVGTMVDGNSIAASAWVAATVIVATELLTSDAVGRGIYVFTMPTGIALQELVALFYPAGMAANSAVIGEQGLSWDGDAVVGPAATSALVQTLVRPSAYIALVTLTNNVYGVTLTADGVNLASGVTAPTLNVTTDAGAELVTASELTPVEGVAGAYTFTATGAQIATSRTGLLIQISATYQAATINFVIEPLVA
jgi:hypothetical protein